MIWLQTPSVFWLSGRTISLSYSMYIRLMMLGRQRYAEPLVPEPSAFDVDMVIEKLIRHKSPGIDKIPAELIKARGKKIQ